MASESSSAVLELTDDAEETEAPAADDAGEGAPLIMEHGYDIAVKVDAPLKQLSTLETFVTYRVRCVCARWPAPPHVRRRYNHFKALHKRLVASHEWLAVPPLPPLHSARQQLDRYSPAFVAVRTRALHAFLDRVAKHPILTHSEDFRLFLTTPDDELEKVFRSENTAMNLWGLSSLYNTADNKHVTNGARVKDPEFSSAAEYLQCVQHKLTALCSLSTKLYRGTTALATELVGMKRACDAWCCGSRGALARAVGGAGAGAGGAGGALARTPPPLRARADLPLLAAYAGVIQEKIKQRDAIHAAQVSEAGRGSRGGEADNRLALASEALRCDLADWVPKTRRDVKRELLDLATKRVNTLTQVLVSWERALQASSARRAEELFPTVTKTAVLNLSPNRTRQDITPTETERDFDDLQLDNYSDSELQDIVQPEHETERDGDILQHDASDKDSDILQHDALDKDGDMLHNALEKDNNILRHEVFDKDGDILHDALDKDSDILRNDVLDKDSDILHQEVLDKDGDIDSKPESDEVSKVDVISDPLQSFSEVDLSS